MNRDDDQEFAGPDFPPMMYTLCFKQKVLNEFTQELTDALKLSPPIQRNIQAQYEHYNKSLLDKYKFVLN